MSDVALELQHVNKSIGGKQIIKDLSFHVKQGEVYGFIGPNGAGKTTTIRMIVGLMKLSSGDVKISGKSIKSNYKEAAQQIGAIVENPELYPFMTGRQNLKHFARMYEGVSKERIKEVVGLVGLERVIDDKVGKYSLGMRQRLGIAQAILHKPSVLILDEPTNGLDPAGIREIRRYIKDLAKMENVAVIISSHLLSEIELICDRIGMIKNGELFTEREVRQDAANEEASQQKVIFDVTPADMAMNIMEDRNITVTKEGNHLAVHLTREEVSELIKVFVLENISVYNVTTVRATLEDEFLELMGGNVIE